MVILYLVLFRYHLGGKRSRFELGCGIGYVIILTEEVEHEDFVGLTFHGVIGYRYQKKNGIIFRACFHHGLLPK